MTANRCVFGITGGSGSGKSYIASLFEKEGVTIFDGDKISKEVALPEGEAYSELYSAFGRDYFDEKGFLNRKKLADLVFSDKSKLGILNSIMHKHIKKRIEKGLENSPLSAIDGAVIIAGPVEELCDFLVGVTAPYELRLSRIKVRDRISEEQAKKRISAQPDDAFYKKHCRYIIENDGKSDLSGEVKKIMEDVLKH